MSTETELPLATEPAKAIDKSISIPGIGDTIIIPEATITRRDTILTQSKAVRAVFDDASRDLALAAIRELKGFRLDANKAREAAKAPINALAKRVEAKIAEFCKETGCGSGEANMGSEEKRLLQAVTRHEADLRRQREQEAAKAAQLQREAEEAQRERDREIARREAEAAQKIKEAEEAAAKAARARTDTSKEKQAELEAQARAAALKAQEEAEMLSIQQEEAALRRAQQDREDRDRLDALSVPVAGLSSKKVWTYECDNIIAFAREFPDLVKCEIKHRDVMEAITNGVFDVKLTDSEKCITPECQIDEKTIRTAPGMRFFQVDKIAVR